ncbi:hypothetical protein [Carboxylicivirga linearis]|uniref:Uncharacterized protein n=1 Tax=Carboxylicivirga linearis TaxID=1628157 RepID=A0ABS5JZN4_9BACT|nr:hypothetical protein [Carboxylicivirga linearis]MBS2100265.1 hypothetical protein [Carboxylicivirga linearis]
MTEIQLNQKEMFGSVLSYLNLRSSVWSVIPKIGVIKNEFEELVASIGAKVIDQDKAKTYLGMEKNQLKRLIAEKADVLNDQVEAFAIIESKAELALRMNQSMTDLYRLKNEMFVDKVTEILEKSENNIDALSGGYGVTADQLVDIDGDLDNFKELNGMPRKYKIDSVIATKDLEVLFADTNALLNNKLDKLMKIFKHRDASFYNGYLAARRIVNN